MENPLGRKGLRYLKTCRDNVRKRWLNEYLHALQERFNSRPEARHGTACLKKRLTVPDKRHDEEQSTLESWLCHLPNRWKGWSHQRIQAPNRLRVRHRPAVRVRRKAGHTAAYRLEGKMANENEED